MLSEPALHVTNRMWRDLVPEDEMGRSERNQRNVETLMAARSPGAKALDLDLAGYISDRWQFPMHSIDLDLIKVSREELERERDAWHPY